MTIGKLFVLYNLYDGKERLDINMFMIAFNWTHVKRVRICNHTECKCFFTFYDQFVGEVWDQTAMEDYLFEFFTEEVFRGVVKDFKIQNEFIANT